jgi:hypothetical protein
VDHLTKLECAVLEKLLAGDLPALEALRSQARSSRIVERRMTGVGFFTTFAVPPDVPRVQGSFQLGDVLGKLEGLAHGAGFLLWVEDGVLEMLEGYTFDEPWPEEIREFSLEYLEHREQDLQRLRG